MLLQPVPEMQYVADKGRVEVWNNDTLNRSLLTLTKLILLSLTSLLVLSLNTWPVCH